MTHDDQHLIERSIGKLEQWIEDHDYKGYDPFDGLSSFLRPLAFQNVLTERILQQSIRHCPINVRPLCGVKPEESPIGRAYMAAGYLKRLQYTGDGKYRDRVRKNLRWLMDNKSPGYEQFSWGNHFDYVSRTGSLPKYEPTIVWTSLIGQAFVDAYEVLREEPYLKTAVSICEWIMSLPRERTPRGACLSYVAYEQSSIHNSNMLGAALLARTGRVTDNHAYLQVAGEAMNYSCASQLPNGAWYYGEAPNLRWVDNFHTGYNLESLNCYIRHTEDLSYKDNLRRGYEFFKNSFFEGNGRPKYYYNRAYPVDIQCAAQAIETLADFSSYDPAAATLALRVARWAITEMQDRKGYFWYRRYPFGIKAKTPMIHWGQATMHKALAGVLKND